MGTSTKLIVIGETVFVRHANDKYCPKEVTFVFGTIRREEIKPTV